MSTPVNALNQTIYVRNLDERVRIPTLVESLREIFEEYGNVIDVVAKSSLKRKGQAFIVFDNVDSAARAIDEIQGFDLFDKPMQLDFARTVSDKTIIRERGEESAEFQNHKRARLAEKERKQAILTALDNIPETAQVPKPGAPGAPSKPGKPARAGGAAVIPDEYLPPNKILFVQNIPEDYGPESLTALFGRYAGFREVRTVPGRTNIAFVEYDNEQNAIDAKQQTGSLVLADKPIKVTYQRQ